MPFTTIEIPLALNGLNKDLEATDLLNSSPNMVNMIVEKGKVRKRLGTSELGENLPLSGIGMELIQYTDSRGDVHHIALTTTHAYEFNSGSKNWLHVTPCVDLNDCETGWTKGQAADTVTHDSTYLIRGTYSTKIVLAAERSDGNLLAYKDITSTDIRAQNQTDADKILTLTHIGFWLRSSAALAASALEVVVSESNHASGEKTGTYVECLSTALVANTWTFVCLAKTLTAFNAVISVSIFANATLASGLSIYLDDIRAYCPFTGGVDNHWSHNIATDTTEFANNGGSALLISNGVDKPLYYEGQSGDYFQRLDISDFSSFAHVDELIEFWNHLFFLNYNDGAQNVKSLAYAALGDVIDWTTSGSSGSSTLTDSIGKIMRTRKLGSDLIIYSEHSITTGRYVGGTHLYIFPTFVFSTGLISTRAVWDFVNVHYFAGTDRKIYGYAGGQHLIPVGDAIEDSMFTEMDVSKISKMLVGLDPPRHKVYFLFAGSSDTYAARCYVFNYKMKPQSWEYYEFNDTIRGFAVLSNKFGWYADGPELEGKYADTDYLGLYADDSYTQEGHPLAVCISHDGYVFTLDEVSGKDRDTAVECIYDTMDITADKEEHYLKINWFSFNAMSLIENATVDVKYSTDGGFSWTDIETVSIADGEKERWKQHRVAVDILDRKCRFRLEQTTAKDLQIRKTHAAVMMESAKE